MGAAFIVVAERQRCLVAAKFGIGEKIIQHFRGRLIELSIGVESAHVFYGKTVAFIRCSPFVESCLILIVEIQIVVSTVLNHIRVTAVACCFEIKHAIHRICQIGLTLSGIIPILIRCVGVFCMAYNLTFGDIVKIVHAAVEGLGMRDESERRSVAGVRRAG